MRSWFRHEQHSVLMSLSTAAHHSLDRAHAENGAPRSQSTATRARRGRRASRAEVHGQVPEDSPSPARALPVVRGRARRFPATLSFAVVTLEIWTLFLRLTLASALTRSVSVSREKPDKIWLSWARLLTCLLRCCDRFRLVQTVQLVVDVPMDCSGKFQQFKASISHTCAGAG